MATTAATLLLSAILLLVTNTAQAERVRLVTGEDYPPFAGSELVDGGSLTRLVQAVFDAAGLDSSVAFKPWARGYEQTLALAFDATFPYLKTPEREADYLFSAPLYAIQSRFFVLHDSDWHTGEQAELQDARLCLPIGYAMRGWVEQENARLLLSRPRSMAQCHEMLLRGRVDALISNAEGVTFHLHMRAQDNALLRALPHPLADSSLHLIIPQQHPQAHELMRRFNLSLENLRDSGRLRQILDEPVKLIAPQTR